MNSVDFEKILQAQRNINLMASEGMADLPVDKTVLESLPIGEFALAAGVMVLGLGGMAASSASADTLHTSRPVARVVTVGPGKTLSEIGQDEGMSVASLMALNPDIENPHKVFAGQKVKVAGQPVRAVGKNIRIVNSGDNLTEFALAKGTSVAAILDTPGNELLKNDPDLLPLNTKVFLPNTGRTTSLTSTSSNSKSYQSANVSGSGVNIHPSNLRPTQASNSSNLVRTPSKGSPVETAVGEVQASQQPAPDQPAPQMDQVVPIPTTPELIAPPEPEAVTVQPPVTDTQIIPPTPDTLLVVPPAEAEPLTEAIPTPTSLQDGLQGAILDTKPDDPLPLPPSEVLLPALLPNPEIIPTLPPYELTSVILEPLKDPKADSIPPPPPDLATPEPLPALSNIEVKPDTSSAPVNPEVPNVDSVVTIDVVKNMLNNSVGKANAEKQWPLIVAALKKQGITKKEILLYAAATVHVETGKFTPITEFASGWAYDPSINPKKAHGLGNTDVGDGPRYKGRGLVQITGKNNYRYYGDLLGIDLVNNPDLALQDDVSAQILALYIKTHLPRLESALNRGDLAAARKVVNGGTNGLKPFSEAYNRGFTATTNLIPPTNIAPQPQIPDIQEPVDPGTSNDSLIPPETLPPPPEAIIIDPLPSLLGRLGAIAVQPIVPVPELGSYASVSTPETAAHVRIPNRPHDKKEKDGTRGADVTRDLKARYNGVSGKLTDELEPIGSYHPDQSLYHEAAADFRLLDDAYLKNFNSHLPITDSDRTLEQQKAVKIMKPNLAATPGTSVHGWGMAIDVGAGANTFSTAENNWLRENAHNFGWIHPYWAEPDGSKPEPWHFEWVGWQTSGNPSSATPSNSVITSAPERPAEQGSSPQAAQPGTPPTIIAGNFPPPPPELTLTDQLLPPLKNILNLIS